jgi:spore coat protein A
MRRGFEPGTLVEYMVRRALGPLALLAGLIFAAPAGAVGFATPLPIPQELTGSDITIHAAKTNVPILDGQATSMWTFNGTFPGPTIRRPAGAETRVTFVNDLPAATGDLTIHHHGEHAISADDGQPDDELIPPAGGQKTYTYDLRENGGPERGAFQWYHDHRLDVTGRNVWNGLAGMFIVDDPSEAALNLPSGAYDVPMMIVDRDFDASNQLNYPILPPAPNDALSGATYLVNGAVEPFMNVSGRKYRLRLLNASNSRVTTFSLTGGREMDQIATESGLLPAPIPRAEIELGPAERAEVVVDFAGAQGALLRLRADGKDILQFNVGPDVADPSSLPSSLRPLPDLGTPVKSRGFSLRQVETNWTIDGQTFDHLRTDAEPKIGTTEDWTFTGGSGTHVVHIHGTDFRVMSRNGAPPPAWEQGLKETVVVHPKERVTVRLRFTDHLGAFVFHCHVLEHEDNGMMARYVVSETGDTVDPPPPPPGGGTTTTTTTTQPDSSSADLAVRWGKAPSRLRPGRKAKLRLDVVNKGTKASPAATVGVGLSGGVKVHRRTHLQLAVPALVPGASKSTTLTVAVPPRIKRAKLAAKLAAPVGGRTADDAAALAFKGLKLRRTAISAAVATLLCRL